MKGVETLHQWRRSGCLEQLQGVRFGHGLCRLDGGDTVETGIDQVVDPNHIAKHCFGGLLQGDARQILKQPSHLNCLVYGA
jgi:hypothetical protein